MDPIEWLTREAEDPGFKQAETVSLATSGLSGLLLGGFWRGAPTTAVVVLVTGSMLAGFLEGRAFSGGLRLAASWLVAGLSCCAVLALLGGVLERITLVHLLPALLVHVLALYSLRVASRPLLVGSALALVSTAALLLPATNASRVTVLTITTRGALLLDDEPIDANTVTSRFHAGEHVRLELSDARGGSPARDLANRILVALEDAGVHVEP